MEIKYLRLDEFFKIQIGKKNITITEIGLFNNYYYLLTDSGNTEIYCASFLDNAYKKRLFNSKHKKEFKKILDKISKSPIGKYKGMISDHFYALMINHNQINIVSLFSDRMRFKQEIIYRKRSINSVISQSMFHVLKYDLPSEYIFNLFLECYKTYSKISEPYVYDILHHLDRIIGDCDDSFINFLISYKDIDKVFGEHDNVLLNDFLIKKISKYKLSLDMVIILFKNSNFYMLSELLKNEKVLNKHVEFIVTYNDIEPLKPNTYENKMYVLLYNYIKLKNYSNRVKNTLLNRILNRILIE